MINFFTLNNTVLKNRNNQSFRIELFVDFLMTYGLISGISEINSSNSFKFSGRVLVLNTNLIWFFEL
jgi:hypothetical protein